MSESIIRVNGVEIGRMKGPIQVIEKIDNITSYCPVSNTFSGTMTIKKDDLGNLSELQKALSISDWEDSTYYDTRLRAESLERTLQMVEYNKEHLILWRRMGPQFPIQKAKNMVKRLKAPVVNLRVYSIHNGRKIKGFYID